MPGSKIIIRAPLMFGVAHVHHLNEFILTHMEPGQSYLSAVATPRIIVNGLLQTTFQFGFTTLFGMFVTFVFLRTGNVYSCILAHTFCNWMGLPRIWGRLGSNTDYDADSYYDHHTRSPDETELDEMSSSSSSGFSSPPASKVCPAFLARPKTKALGLEWTIAYYALLFGGAYGFWKLLYPLTESDNRLTPI